jgi:hypothetical protein
LARPKPPQATTRPGQNITISDLGGIQSVKQCNLSVETFETLGKLCSNYAFHLYQKNHAAGKPVHHRHAHMHTCATTGINLSLTDDLEKSFTWTPLLAVEGGSSDDLKGLEDISLEELDAAFDELANCRASSPK